MKAAQFNNKPIRELIEEVPYLAEQGFDVLVISPLQPIKINLRPIRNEDGEIIKLIPYKYKDSYVKEHINEFKFNTPDGKYKEGAMAFKVTPGEEIEYNEEICEDVDEHDVEWWKLYQPTGFGREYLDELKDKLNKEEIIRLQNESDDDYKRRRGIEKFKSYHIGNHLGTEKDIRDLANVCHKYGIKLLADAVCDHVAGSEIDPRMTLEYKNARSDAERQKIADNIRLQPHPLVDKEMTPNPYIWKSKFEVRDWNNRKEVIEGCVGCPGLRTDNVDLMYDKILPMLFRYIDLGIDGFRFDAAKNIALYDENGCLFWDKIPDEVNRYVSKLNENRNDDEKLDPPIMYAEVLGNKELANAYSKHMLVFSDSKCPENEKIIKSPESHDQQFNDPEDFNYFEEDISEDEVDNAYYRCATEHKNILYVPRLINFRWIYEMDDKMMVMLSNLTEFMTKNCPNLFNINDLSDKKIKSYYNNLKNNTDLYNKFLNYIRENKLECGKWTMKFEHHSTHEQYERNISFRRKDLIEIIKKTTNNYGDIDSLPLGLYGEDGTLMKIVNDIKNSNNYDLRRRFENNYRELINAMDWKNRDKKYYSTHYRTSEKVKGVNFRDKWDKKEAYDTLKNINFDAINDAFKNYSVNLNGSNSFIHYLNLPLNDFSNLILDNYNIKGRTKSYEATPITDEERNNLVSEFLGTISSEYKDEYESIKGDVNKIYLQRIGDFKRRSQLDKLDFRMNIDVKDNVNDVLEIVRLFINKKCHEKGDSLTSLYLSESISIGIELLATEYLRNKGYNVIDAERSSLNEALDSSQQYLFEKELFGLYNKFQKNGYGLNKFNIVAYADKERKCLNRGKKEAMLTDLLVSRQSTPYYNTMLRTNNRGEEQCKLATTDLQKYITGIVYGSILKDKMNNGDLNRTALIYIINNIKNIGFGDFFKLLDIDTTKLYDEIGYDEDYVEELFGSCLNMIKDVKSDKIVAS